MQKSFTSNQDQNDKHYTKPATWVLLWLDYLLKRYAPVFQWHRTAPKDIPYLQGLQQRHQDRAKKTWFLPQVSSIKTLWITATTKEERHSVPGYHSTQSRCIYFAKSLAQDSFQKHPSLGWTEAELPLEMSYYKALDPTNCIPEAISRFIAVKALPWIFIGLNMKDKCSNISYLHSCVFTEQFFTILFLSSHPSPRYGYNCYQYFLSLTCQLNADILNLLLGKQQNISQDINDTNVNK